MIFNDGKELEVKLLELGLKQLEKMDSVTADDISSGRSIIGYAKTKMKIEREQDSRVGEAIERFKGEMSFIIEIMNADNNWYELSETFNDIRNVLDEIEDFVVWGNEGRPC